MPHSISERIKNRRKELNLSQAELASKAGLQPPAISQYESGARRPSFEALRKLSFGLNVSTEYLISGHNQIETTEHLEKNDRIFLKVIHSLSLSNREKLLEYATFLATGRKMKVDALFETPSDYAKHLLEGKADKKTPIDMFSMAKELGLKVLEDDLDEGEGLLIQADHPIIILDKKIQFQSRKKFTIATLIGHYIIPWHLKPSYIIRKYESNTEIEKVIKKREQDEMLMGFSTLLTEEVEEMEAHEFASNILIPSKELINDFLDQKATIDTLKELADKKYNVSLFLLLNRLVDFKNDKYAVVQSKDSKIIKIFQGKRPIVSSDVDNRSFAATFISNPSVKEEIREGDVPAACWVLDAKENEYVYEQSIYNPKVGRVLTLLTFDR